MGDAEKGPLFVTAKGLASALSLTPRTIIRYIRRGELSAVIAPPVPARYFEPHAQRQKGSHYLIRLDSVEAMLTRMFGGESVPPGIMRRLRQLAQSPKAHKP